MSAATRRAAQAAAAVLIVAAVAFGLLAWAVLATVARGAIALLAGSLRLLR